MIQNAINLKLARSALDLRDQLEVLCQNYGVDSFIVTHNGADLLVYASHLVRAFIPKRWDGWQVVVSDISEMPKVCIEYVRQIEKVNSDAEEGMITQVDIEC